MRIFTNRGGKVIKFDTTDNKRLYNNIQSKSFSSEPPRTDDLDDPILGSLLMYVSDDKKLLKRRHKLWQTM